MAEDIFEDDAAEIAELEKDQRADKGTIGGKPEVPAVEPEPKPDAEAKPDAAPKAQEPAEDPDDTVEVENKGRFVRYGALRESRAKEAEAKKERDDAKRERDALQAQFASEMSKAQERLAELAKGRQQPQAQPQEVTIPDINTDPIGHFQAKLASQDARLAEERKWREDQTAQQQNHGQREQLKTEVERLEREYVAKQPDYYEAQKHLVEAWKAEARAAGYDESGAVAARTIETIQIAARTNKNPAEIAYALAKVRGYAGPQAPKPQPDLAAIARGQEAARSPSAIAGTPQSGTPSIQALLDMSDEDFAAATDGNKWRKIMAPAGVRA